MYSRLTILAITFLFIISSCKEHPNSADDHYFNSFFEQADSLSDEHHFEAAVQLVDSAYAQFKQPNTRDLVRKLTYQAQILYFKQGKYIETLEKVDSLLEITKDDLESYGENYVDALYYKGNILIALNDNHLGSQYFQKAYQFTKEHLDICQKSYYHGHLASLLFKQGKYKQGIQQYHIYFAENGNCDKKNVKNYFSSRQNALNSIGFGYEQLGMYDSAALYYHKTIDYIDTVGVYFPNYHEFVNIARSVTLGNLGGIYLHQKKYDEALIALDSSINFNSQHPDYAQDVCLSKIKRAHVYIRTSQWDLYNSDILEIDSCLKILNTIDYQYRYYRLKWEYADELKDTSNAYLYHLKMKQLNDQLNKSIFNKAQIDYQQLLQNINQENELVQLRASNRQKTIYIILFILVVCMSLIIMFLFRRNQIQSKFNMEQLNKHNVQMLNKTVQLQKTLFDLQDSQQENTQMMKIVAHDLRNPISAIVQITQLIQMDKAIPEEQMSLVNMIQSSARASLEFINDLLHLNTSFENIKKEDLDISSVLQNSIELLNFKASEKNQKLLLETEPAFCMANREKLWRVFNNLIANAIKFSPENSEIQISLKKSGQTAICKIKDQGIGIPEEIKHQIFDLFTEAKRSGTSGEQSFGLGLAISKQIIESHQGKIWFESEEDEGTTFFIELPLYNI